MISTVRFGSSTPAKPDSKEVSQPIPVSFYKFFNDFKTKLPLEIRHQILKPRQELAEDIFHLQKAKDPKSEQEMHFKINLLTQHTFENTAENNLYLNFALMHGHQSLFNALLQTTQNPDLPILIERAILAKNDDAFNKLLSRVKSPIPTETIQWAAECGQPDKLRRLFEHSTLSSTQKKALWHLAKQQKERIQQFSELSLKKRQKELFAIAGGSSKFAFDRYLKANYSVAAFDRYDDDIFRRALTQRYQRLDLLALLQTPGMNVNIKDKLKRSPLHDAAASGNTTCIDTLIKAPHIRVNSPDADGWTALHEAASQGRAESVKALLKASGIHVNKQDSEGETALHKAVIIDHANCVKELLKADRINPNISSKHFGTPLHDAACKGYADCVTALLTSKKIDPDKTSGLMGETAWHYAEQNGHQNIVQILREHGAKEIKSQRQVLAEISQLLTEAQDIQQAQAGDLQAEAL